MRDKLMVAWMDIFSTVRHWRIWATFSWYDIKLRYRRTSLGPIWLVVSTALMIGAMGSVFSILFHQDLSTFFPYLATGVVVWNMIVGIITESCGAFVDRAEIYKNLSHPYMHACNRVIFRNLIIFLHNFLIIIGVALIFHLNLLKEFHWFLLGLALFLFNTTWIVLILALVTTRFRDVSQLVLAFMNVAFLITPIFWKKDLLQGHEWIIHINPLAQFITILREPLLGTVPEYGAYLFVFVLGVLGWLMTFLLFAAKRSNIVYWL